METYPFDWIREIYHQSGNGSLPGILLNSRLSWGLIPIRKTRTKGGWKERSSDVAQPLSGRSYHIDVRAMLYDASWRQYDDLVVYEDRRHLFQRADGRATKR